MLIFFFFSCLFIIGAAPIFTIFCKQMILLKKKKTQQRICFLSLVYSSALSVVCFVIWTSVINYCCRFILSQFSTVIRIHKQSAAASAVMLKSTYRVLLKYSLYTERLCGEFVGIWKKYILYLCDWMKIDYMIWCMKWRWLA